MSQSSIEITTTTETGRSVQYYSRKQLDGYSDSVQARLKKAKKDKADIVCCCKTPNVPMHIKNRNNRYALCRNPKTGKDHAPYCASYAEPYELSGRNGYSEKAVKVIDDKVIISPDFSLSMNTTPATVTTSDTPSSSSQKRNTVKLLGVLQLIYEAAGFNRWFPKMKGKRTYNGFAYYMKQTLANMQFTRGRAMQDAIVVISNQVNVKKAVKKICFADGKKPKRRAVIIGRIMQVKKARFVKEQQTYALTHINDNDFTPFYLSEAQWLNCQRSYIRTKANGDDFKPDTTQFYIIISVVSMNKAGSITIEQCAVMPVTRDFIPYDSSYEKKVAEALVEQDRAFSKPLRYDSTELTFPDFMLNDMPTPVPMEVYGMINDAAYTKRKQDKNCYYKTHYPHFWSWDLAMMPVMPAFPKTQAIT